VHPYRRRDGKSPYWYVDTIDPATGKRRRVSTKETDIRKARKKAEELAARPRGVDITLGDALDAYVETLKADGKRSWRDALARADKTLGRVREGDPADRWAGRFSLDAAMLVSRLTPQHVRALKVARAQEGNAPGTIAAELRNLRAAVRAAEDAGYAGAAVKRWGVPKVDAKLRYLDVAEAQRVLRRLHPDTPVPSGRHRKMVVPKGQTYRQRQDVHDLFLALVLTGGRWNEIAHLTPRQINLRERTLTLYGFKGQRERTIPLVDEAVAMFQRRLDNMVGSYVFPGVGVRARKGPSRAIYRAMDAVGCNDPGIVAAFGRATIHSLRHTYGAWLRQRGLALDEIQPLLGHADIKTTQIYAPVVQADVLTRASLALANAAAQMQSIGTPPAHLPDTVCQTADRDSPNALPNQGNLGAPSRARTGDPRLRRSLLYPTELRAPEALLSRRRRFGQCDQFSDRPKRKLSA